MNKQDLVEATILLGEIEEKAKQAHELLGTPDADYYVKRVVGLLIKISEDAEEGAGLLNLAHAAADLNARKGLGYTPGTKKPLGVPAGGSSAPRRLSVRGRVASRPSRAPKK